MCEGGFQVGMVFVFGIVEEHMFACGTKKRSRIITKHAIAINTIGF
jgi:hypothetical protein